jgi:hypothetical protein
MFKEMRDKRKANSKQQQDSLSQDPSEAAFQATLAEEKKKYEDIMNRLDQYNIKSEDPEANVQIQGL